jgi:hypothetical protein
MRKRADELPENVRPLLNGLRDWDWISWRLLDIGEKGKAFIVNSTDGGTIAHTLCTATVVDLSDWAIPNVREDQSFLKFSAEKTRIYIDGGRINIILSRFCYMLLIMAHPYTLAAVVAILTLAAQALQDIAVTATQNLRLAAFSIGIAAAATALVMELAFIDNKFSANMLNQWMPRCELVARLLYPDGISRFKQDLFIISRSTPVAAHGRDTCPYLQSGPGMRCSTGLSLVEILSTGAEVYSISEVGGNWDERVLFVPPEPSGTTIQKIRAVPLYRILTVTKNSQLWHLDKIGGFLEPSPTMKLVPLLRSEDTVGHGGVGHDDMV